MRAHVPSTLSWEGYNSLLLARKGRPSSPLAVLVPCLEREGLQRRHRLGLLALADDFLRLLALSGPCRNVGVVLRSAQRMKRSAHLDLLHPLRDAGHCCQLREQSPPTSSQMSAPRLTATASEGLAAGRASLLIRIH